MSLAKLSEGLRARHQQSLVTHGSRLTDGLGRHQVGLLQASGLRAGLVAPLFDPTMAVYTPGDLRQYHTRTTPAWAVDATGLLRQYAANELRIVPSPVGLPAALREPAATNLLLQSGDVSNAVWSKAAGGVGSVPVVTQNFGVAPDGTVTAARVQLALNGGTATADISRVFQSAAVANGVSHANSVFVKTNDGSTKTLSFRDDFASIGTGVLVVVDGNWQRVAAAAVAGNSTSNAAGLWLRGQQGTSDSADLLVWGGQLEVGLFPTSYVPTGAATASRARDEFVLPIAVGPGQPHSQLIDFVLPYDQAGTNRLTGDNAIGLAITPGSGNFQAFNGTSAVNIGSPPYTKGTRGRAGYAGDVQGRSICMGGTVVASDTQTHTAVTRVVLGALTIGTDSQAPLLYIHEFRTWRRRLPNDVLRLATQ